MNVDGQDLRKFNENLYQQLVRYPLEAIPIFDIVIAEIAMQRMPDWSRHIQVGWLLLHWTGRATQVSSALLDQSPQIARGCPNGAGTSRWAGNYSAILH